VVTGVVTNNQDPEKLGRVKLKFPWVSDTDESGWARVAMPIAGKSGMFLLPEVGDEVLVAFERGDPRFPYVIGSLWNSSAPPPETNEDGKNDLRLLKSRSGHVVKLNDKDGEETIEIIDKSGKNSIVISTKDNTLTLKADQGITLESANGKVILKGKGVEITSDDAFKMESKKDAEVKSDGQVTVKGSTINLN
jgi:uncharacterized protein involved in type VI secretion and phage assembly